MTWRPTGWQRGFLVFAALVLMLAAVSRLETGDALLPFILAVGASILALLPKAKNVDAVSPAVDAVISKGINGFNSDLERRFALLNEYHAVMLGVHEGFLEQQRDLGLLTAETYNGSYAAMMDRFAEDRPGFQTSIENDLSEWADVLGDGARPAIAGAVDRRLDKFAEDLLIAARGVSARFEARHRTK